MLLCRSLCLALLLTKLEASDGEATKLMTNAQKVIANPLQLSMDETKRQQLAISLGISATPFFDDNKYPPSEATKLKQPRPTEPQATASAFPFINMCTTGAAATVVSSPALSFVASLGGKDDEGE